MLTADFDSAPFSPWLESVVKELFDINPVSIAMQMRDADEKVYTCYWNVSANDRAVMIDALADDGKLDWLRENRDLVLEILNDEEGEEDGLCESDTETDSEG